MLFQGDWELALYIKCYQITVCHQQLFFILFVAKPSLILLWLWCLTKALLFQVANLRAPGVRVRTGRVQPTQAGELLLAATSASATVRRPNLQGREVNAGDQLPALFYELVLQHER